MAYTKTTWANDSAPALSADNLNNIENAIAGLVDAFYPVGSIIMTTTSTNPGERPFMDNTTWVAWGSGRVPVGVDTADTAFDTVEETGGSKDAIVPSHTHTATFKGNALGGHSHRPQQAGMGYGFVRTNATVYNDTANLLSGSDNKYPYVSKAAAFGSVSDTSSDSAGTPTGTVTVNGAGSSATNANLQPYITCYMWKRTE